MQSQLASPSFSSIKHKSFSQNPHHTLHHESHELLTNITNSKLKNFINHPNRRLEAPDVTGSSLTLGAAGSRRTVYLIDENQKIPETRSSGNTPEPQTPKNNNCNSSNGSSGSNSLTNNNSSTNTTPAPAVTESPSTFLMYNRINTMISSGGSPTDPNGSNTSLAGNILSSTTNPVDDKLLRKKQEEKSNSIWYEYGCV